MNDVDQYISKFPEPTRSRLIEIRLVLQEVMPQAEQGMKWNKAAFSTDTILAIFAGYTNHVSLHVTVSALDAFRSRLSGYKLGNGTIQFPNNQPLPADLIREIAIYRLNEFKDAGILWIS